MAWFIEARDPSTGGHLWRVSCDARHGLTGGCKRKDKESLMSKGSP